MSRFLHMRMPNQERVCIQGRTYTPDKRPDDQKAPGQVGHCPMCDDQTTMSVYNGWIDVIPVGGVWEALL